MVDDSSLQPRMRFNGIAKCKMDAQRRLLMPKLWRDQMAHLQLEQEKKVFYLMPGPGNSVKIGDYYYYDHYCDYLEHLNDSKLDTLRAKTQFSMLTVPVELDGQGRFQLTPELLLSSKLGNPGDTLVFVGASDFGRIMSEADYEQLFLDSMESIQKLNEDVQRLKTKALNLE